MTYHQKEVFGTHAQTAHVWAQQNHNETHHGRSSDGRVFFARTSIFSYRSTWTIARFVTNKRGERAVLLNEDNYSISTAKHTTLTRRAIPDGIPVFTVPNPERTPDSGETKAHLTKKLDAFVLSAIRARANKEWRMRDAERLVESANALAKFFGWRWRLKKPEWTPEFIADAKTRSEREATKHKAAKKLAEARAAKEMAERIEAWRNGEHVTYWGIWNKPIMLRRKGNKIETSQGKVVPVEHAKRLWPAVKRCHDKAAAWQANGHTLAVGHFRVDQIDADGTLHAGCHTIRFDELERMARVLGLV